MTDDQRKAAGEAEQRAYQTRRLSHELREQTASRNRAIRAAAAAGVGTRELARGTGLDPAHVHRIIHSEPKDG